MEIRWQLSLAALQPAPFREERHLLQLSEQSTRAPPKRLRTLQQVQASVLNPEVYLQQNTARRLQSAK